MNPDQFKIMQWFGPFVNFSTTQKIASAECFLSKLASVSTIQSKSFTFFRPFCQPVNKQNSTIASVLQSYYPFGFIFPLPSPTLPDSAVLHLRKSAKSLTHFEHFSKSSQISTPVSTLAHGAGQGRTLFKAFSDQEDTEKYTTLLPRSFKMIQTVLIKFHFMTRAIFFTGM